MRKSRRNLVLGLAVALALGVAGVAYAANTTVSTVTQTVTPSDLSATKFKDVKLFVHTSTHNLTANQRPASAQNVDLDFDNSQKFFTKYLKTCHSSNPGADLANKSTSEAVAICGQGSVVGHGSAQAVTGQGPTFTTHTAVVTAFNGKKDANGHPTIILHTRFGADLGNVTVVLIGVLVPSPVGGDFGKRLQVHNIPQVPCVPLSDFQTTVHKTYTHKVNGVKKTFHYTLARCDDADKRINVRGTFDYSTAGEDTDVANGFANCT
jgi:hypothetical protein